MGIADLIGETIWGAVIWLTLRTVFLSVDIQGGLALDLMRVVNPPPVAKLTSPRCWTADDISANPEDGTS